MPPQDESRITRRSTSWAIIFGAWTLFALAQTILASAMTNHWESEYLVRSAVQFFPRVFIWAAVTPLIAALDTRARRTTSSILGRIGFHFPFFVVMCIVQAALRRTTIQLIMPGPMLPFYITVLYFADIEAVRYVASLVLGRVLQASRELVRREQRTAALKEEIAQAQLHYLDLQLQPHFMFNALGSISELAHEAPAQASRMVEHLTSLLRYATQPRTGQEVTLREELGALAPYLEIQRMRFPDWLTIEEHIEPEAEDAMVPRMLLQPLVENAIRHGLSNRRSGGRIEFGASIHGNDLVLSVYDNGVGFSAEQKSPGLGIGLGNIRERLATLYGTSQSLELLTHDQGGVEVLLRIPFKRSIAETAKTSASDIEDPTDLSPSETYIPESRTRLLPLLGNWIIAGGLLTSLSLFYIQIRPKNQAPALEIVRRHLVHISFWIAVTPLVLWLVKKFPLTKGRMKVSVPLHLAAGIVVALAQVTLGKFIFGANQPPLFSGFYMDAIFWNITAYGVLIAIAQRSNIEEWIRERDVAAAKMRAELTTARLSTVMLELRPDFLLQSLASLRTLVAFDAAKAEALLTNLADFLRLTLESLTKPTVSVSREIALLDAYANVHRAGAGHFPEVLLEIPKPVEDEVVPTGVTRMLTERLLESGNIPECIVVSIRRTDAALTIRVADATVSEMSEAGKSARIRDPFGRLARLTDTGAVVRFSEETSSLEVDLPRKRGNSHAQQKSAPLALQYG
jgi:LytS/YehU family sensor histidine kinase